eukprot:gene425-392_t
MSNFPGIQDMHSMIRYQGLIEGEKTLVSQHPATKLQRERFMKSLKRKAAKGLSQSCGQLGEMPSSGCILQVGLNKDPRKVKYEERVMLAKGEVPPEDPRKRPYLPQIINDGEKARQERRLSKMSSTRHYLEQAKGLVTDPHGSGGGFHSGVSNVPDDMRELIYSGVSEEFEGRYAYLKARSRQKLLDRWSKPITTTQASSWELENYKKTNEWAPPQITGNRGVMLRAMAEDAPTLAKSTDIVNNNLAMETILGHSRGDFNENRGEHVDFGNEVRWRGTHRDIYESVYKDGPDRGKPSVAKFFRDQSLFGEKDYIEAQETARRAGAIARDFQKELYKLGERDVSIKVNQCEPWEVDAGPRAKQICLVEPKLENFQKFNSNSGAANDDPCMQALSHYSYHASGGAELLYELQGCVGTNDFGGTTYTLSDVVFCPEAGPRGAHDMGKDGIRNFFGHHRCNKICAQWTTPAGATKIYEAKWATCMRDPNAGAEGHYQFPVVPDAGKFHPYIHILADEKDDGDGDSSSVADSEDGATGRGQLIFCEMCKRKHYETTACKPKRTWKCVYCTEERGMVKRTFHRKNGTSFTREYHRRHRNENNPPGKCPIGGWDNEFIARR